MSQAKARSYKVVGVAALAFFTDYFFYGMIVPLMPHSPALAGGKERLGSLYGGYAISVLLVTPLFGYFGDRLGRKPTVICGVILATCATALLALAPNFALSLLGRIFQGAGSAAIWTAGLALVAEHYVENRVELIGYAFTGSTAGSALGPFAGGFLFHIGGYRFPFLISGFLLLAVVCLLILFLPVERTGRLSPPNLRSLLLNRFVAVPSLAVTMAAFGWGILEPLLPARLGGYGARPKSIGLMFTVAAIAYGLSARLVSYASERLPFKIVILLGASAMAFLLPFMAAFKPVGLAGLVLCLVSVSFAFLLNPASAELGNAVDRTGMSCYSSVYAVYNIVYSVGMLATIPLISGSRFLGFLGVLLCASAVLVLCIPLLMVVPSEARVSAVP